MVSLAIALVLIGIGSFMLVNLFLGIFSNIFCAIALADSAKGHTASFNVPWYLWYPPVPLIMAGVAVLVFR